MAQLAAAEADFVAADRCLRGLVGAALADDCVTLCHLHCCCGCEWRLFSWPRHLPIVAGAWVAFDTCTKQEEANDGGDSARRVSG